MSPAVLREWAMVGDLAGPFLIDTLLKATLLLAVACLATVLIRPASAAIRHRIWSTAFLCLLLLPLLSALLPDLRLPILSQMTSPHFAQATSPSPKVHAAIEPPETVKQDTNLGLLRQLAGGLAPRAAPPDKKPAEDAETLLNRSPNFGTSGDFGRGSDLTIPWQALLFTTWGVGLAVAIFPIVFGLVRNRLLGRCAVPVSGEAYCRVFRELCRCLSLNRSVRLLETRHCLVPMTWGIFRPIVLVPHRWRDWPDDRRRIVLLHELAHVKRWDAAFQLAARLACAVYWFHPLVWYAIRQMRAEREMACDDCVLLAGEQPANYAGHLLQIARDCRSLTMATAVAMAQPRGRGLEQRVRAMLDRTRCRVPMGPVTRIAVLVVAAILLIGVAVAEPSVSASWEPGTARAASPAATKETTPIVTLTGHDAAVWQVGFGAGRRRAVSVDRSGMVRVWNLPRGRVNSSWSALDHDSESAPSLEVHSAAISSDGKMLAVGDSDSVITLWDVATGRPGYVLRGHTGAILGVAFSPDGTRLVSGGIDRILRVWNTETGEPVHEGYDGNSFRIQAVGVTPDGETIISGDRDNVVKLWKMHEKRYLVGLPPDGSVLALAGGPDNRGLAAGLDHGSISLWGGGLGEESKRQVLPGHCGDVTAVAFDPGGSVLASTGIDGMLKLWDTITGRNLASVRAHLGGARCMAFSADGTLLITGGEDGEVKVWDVAAIKKSGGPWENRVPIAEPERGIRAVRHEALNGARIKMLGGVFLAKGSGGTWSPDAEKLAFGAQAGGVGIVDLKTGRQRTLVDQGCDPAWSPRGNVIAYACGEPGEEEIRLCDLSRSDTVRVAEGLAPAWSPDGTTLYFTGRDRALRAVSWLPGGATSEPRTIAPHVQGYPAPTPDGRHITYFNEIEIVSIECQSGVVSRLPYMVGDNQAALAWSPDGRQLICAGHATGLQLFDSSGRPALRLIRTRVSRPAWSPDGRRIAFDVTLAEEPEIWMVETKSLASWREFHAAHHPTEEPDRLDVGTPFAPKGKLVPLDLSIEPDPRFPPGALGNPLDDLFDLPRGEQALAGVRFHIGQRPVQLGHEYLPQAPDRVVGIPVNRHVERLYVLQSAG